MVRTKTLVPRTNLIKYYDKRKGTLEQGVEKITIYMLTFFAN